MGMRSYMIQSKKRPSGLLLAADWGAPVEVMTAGIPLFELESVACFTYFCPDPNPEIDPLTLTYSREVYARSSVLPLELWSHGGAIAR